MYQETSPRFARAKRLYFRPAGGGPSALSITFGRNLKRLRSERGYSLEVLAEAIGVDVPALDAIESGKGEPTLEFAWKIAAGLDVPFSALIADQVPRGSVIMRKKAANLIVSEDLGLTTRALLPFHADQNVEFYELHLAPKHKEDSFPHRTGTVEVLFVATGTLEVSVGREPPNIVGKGDVIVFPGDLPHSYRNLSEWPSVIYLVMHYRPVPVKEELRG